MSADSVEVNINIKNLTEGINKLTNAFADGMAHINERASDGMNDTSKMQKEWMARQDKMHKDRGEHDEKRYKLMANARVMESMTRSNQGIVGTAMNFMGGMGQAKMGDMQRLQSLRDKKDKTVFEQKEMKDLQSMNSVKILDKMSKKFDGYFGGSSKWNKMFGGHGKMAATGIGLGAAGIGFAAVQKGVTLAIESSPLLQQMLKLWKFGILMLLRPIATFFGMIMRPIMIVMLRKFIIPFYQKYMPAMMVLGDKIGNLLAGGIGDLFGWNGEENQVLALTQTAAALVGGGIALKYLGVTATKAITFPITLAGKAITASFKGFDLLVPAWLKKLLPTPVVTPPTTDPTSTSSASTTTKAGDGVRKTGSTFKTGTGSTFKPDTGSKASTTFQQNQGNVNTNTGKVTSPQEAEKIRLAKQAEAVKYSTNTTKSDKLMDRVKDIFKRKGIVRGFEALRSLMPKMNFPKVKMDGLKNLLSMATAKGVFKGVLGGIAGGGASAGGLPWMIAENLDYLPPAKEFRLWFQSGFRQAAGMEDSEGNRTGEGGLDGRFIDDALGGTEKPNISNPISQGIAGASKHVQEWWANMQNGTGGIFGAEGGILNEPVVGYGQSTGRKYTLGENGRESVTPLNKTGGQSTNGGNSITINIQSMSGSQNDLNNLKRVILNVIQESSIGRVRA